jgi:hypothetical protein
MTMKIVMAFAVLLALGMASQVVFKASAQGGGGALVVATCGTLGQAYAVGATRRLTVNTNGQVCQ